MSVLVESSDASGLDSWLLEHLVCPRTKRDLRLVENRLVSPEGDEYGIVDGIPVMLPSHLERTHWSATYSLWKAGQLSCPEHPTERLREENGVAACAQGHHYKIDSGVPAELLPEFLSSVFFNAIMEREQNPDKEYAGVDPFVSYVIGATGGFLWGPAVGSLRDYPIPDLRLPPSNGEIFIELGSNWGRWCIAAARKGYRAVGIDPSLLGLQAAQRVARQLGVEGCHVVADSRYLPFGKEMADVVFSYSVLQSMAKENVRATAVEVARVLKPEGRCMIQMANRYGIRQTYQRWRLRKREVKKSDFYIRWWTVGELKRTFENLIGPTKLTVDGFFTLNSQSAEAHLLPWSYRQIVRLSDVLRDTSKALPILTHVADSVYVNSVKA